MIQCASTFSPVTQDQLKTAQPQPPFEVHRAPFFTLVSVFFTQIVFQSPPISLAGHLSTMLQSLTCSGGSLAVVFKAMQDRWSTIGSQLEVVEHGGS